MRHQQDDRSKIPYIDIWVEREDNLVSRLSYTEIINK